MPLGTAIGARRLGETEPPEWPVLFPRQTASSVPLKQSAVLFRASADQGYLSSFARAVQKGGAALVETFCIPFR